MKPSTIYYVKITLESGETYKDTFICNNKSELEDEINSLNEVKEYKIIDETPNEREFRDDQD